MIDPKELAQKAQSKFGPAKPLVRPRWKIMLEDYFFKNSIRRSYLQGGLTVGLLVYWWFTRNFIPLMFWFAFVVLNNIAALYYWKKESKRLQEEIQKYEQEIRGIQKEILERQSYFEDIKKQLNKMTNKN